MEFGRVSGDHYAGYVVEDSDLEYSDCSEPDRYCKFDRYHRTFKLFFYIVWLLSSPFVERNFRRGWYPRLGY